MTTEGDEFEQAVIDATANAEVLERLQEALRELETKKDAAIFVFLESVSCVAALSRRKFAGSGRSAGTKIVQAAFGNAARMPRSRKRSNFYIRLAYPNLALQARNKYAAALDLAERRKPPGQSLSSFVDENDGFNGCVKKMRSIRNAEQFKKTAKRKKEERR